MPAAMHILLINFGSRVHRIRNRILYGPHAKIQRENRLFSGLFCGTLAFLAKNTAFEVGPLGTRAARPHTQPDSARMA
jgi:hypothetical protein